MYKSETERISSLRIKFNKISDGKIEICAYRTRFMKKIKGSGTQ